jgi:hypothetical protein
MNMNDSISSSSMEQISHRIREARKRKRYEHEEPMKAVFSKALTQWNDMNVQVSNSLQALNKRNSVFPVPQLASIEHKLIESANGILQMFKYFQKEKLETSRKLEEISKVVINSIKQSEQSCARLFNGNAVIRTKVNAALKSSINGIAQELGILRRQ